MSLLYCISKHQTYFSYGKEDFGRHTLTEDPARQTRPCRTSVNIETEDEHNQPSYSTCFFWGWSWRPFFLISPTALFRESRRRRQPASRWCQIMFAGKHHAILYELSGSGDIRNLERRIFHGDCEEQYAMHS